MRPKAFFDYWLPVLAWAGLIFYFSSIPNLELGLPAAADFLFRKAAHALMYFVLTSLIWRALHTGHGVETKKALVLAMLCALLYAASDETHQRFVSGRHGRVRDVAVDAVGIVGASIALRRTRQSS